MGSLSRCEFVQLASCYFLLLFVSGFFLVFLGPLTVALASIFLVWPVLERVAAGPMSREAEKTKARDAHSRAKVERIKSTSSPAAAASFHDWAL